MTDSRDLRLAVSLLLAVMLLVLPGMPTSLFGGTPLSAPARAVLVAVVAAGGILVVFRSQRRLPGVWLGVLVLLCAVKVVSGARGEPAGWQGRYQMLDEPPAQAVFFWRFGMHHYRIDRTIDFEAERFGLHFLNQLRYSTGVYIPMRREVQIPLLVTWKGWVRASAGRAFTAEVTARGTALVEVDGREVFRGTNPAQQHIRLEFSGPGDHELLVAYEKPADVDPLIRFVWLSGPDGEVTPRPVPRESQRRRDLLAWMTTAMVVSGVVGVVAFTVRACLARAGVVRPRLGANPFVAMAVAGGFAVLCATAHVISAPFIDRTYFMSAGNDPLAYEGAARDVMQHGLLMPAGSEPGRGAPYYFYPLYPYVLALVHWLVGEDIGAVFLANMLLVSSSLLLLWTMGWHRLGVAAAVPALAVLAWMMYQHLLPYACEVFTDNLFLPLVLVALNLGVWAVRSGSRSAALLAGAACAMGAAARPSLLTFLPVLLAAVLTIKRRAGMAGRLRICGFLLAGFVLGVSPFAARNYVMSRQPVLLVNSWVQIPYFLIPPEEPNPFAAQPLTLLESVSEASAVVREHPVRSIFLELRKIGFMLGFTNLGKDQPLRSGFVLLTCLGVLSLMLGRLDQAGTVVTVAFAVSHVGALTLAAPWTYGYKSILPLQLVFLFWAGLLFAKDGPREGPCRAGTGPVLTGR